MPTVLSTQHLHNFATARQTVPNLPIIGIVSDSANLTGTGIKIHGESASQDLSTILDRARQLGTVREAWMVGDSRVPRFVVEYCKKNGWKVDMGGIRNPDDRVVRLCVAVAMEVDILVILGGDHIVVDALRLIQMARKRVAVMAIRDATAPCLIRTAMCFGPSPSHLKGRWSGSYQLDSPAPKRRLG